MKRTMTTHKTDAEPVAPDELARELQRQRELLDARRADELARLRAEAGHGRARADVAEESRAAELARAEREAEAAADAELAQMYRQFRTAGERTRIRSLMARSGEARALCLEQLRSRNLLILVPLLVGFGIWSTTGVQQGAARLMAVTPHSPVWWVLWGLESLLIGVVCWIIVVRARLSTSGGELSGTAEKIGFGCLGVSIFLNLVAAVPAGDGPHVSGWAVPGAMFAHAIGPVGAAITAHLIGVIDQSISDADPWHDRQTGVAVPRLAEMDLRLPDRAGGAAAPVTEVPAGDAEASDSGKRPAAWPVPVEGRRMLPIVGTVAAEDEQDDDASEADPSPAAGMQLEYTGPVADTPPQPGQAEQADERAQWHRERPDVREAIARVLGDEVVRGAEHYLAAHTESPGTLRELPPPAGERPANDPDEAPRQHPTRREKEAPATAHDDVPEQSRDQGNGRPAEAPDERPTADHDDASGTERLSDGADGSDSVHDWTPMRMPRQSRSSDPRARLAAVRRLLVKEPNLSGSQIAARLGLPESTARRLARQVRREQDQNGGER